MTSDKIYNIIEEGINHLKRFGPGFSLDDLCFQLSISKKTFYSHFESKSQFLEIILIEIVNNWKTHTQNILLFDEDLKSSFLAIMNYHIDEIITFNNNFLRNLRSKFPKESRIIDEYYQELTNQLLSLLLKGQKNNKVKSGYNFQIFLKKEQIFFEYLFFKENIFQTKKDFLKLLTLSLEGILIEKTKL